MHLRKRLVGWLAILLGSFVLLASGVYLGAMETLDDMSTLQTFSDISQGWLKRYGVLLHVFSHGLTYLCLIGFWPRILTWMDYLRRQRDLPELMASDRRNLAWCVILLCGGYEFLLWSRILF